MLSCAALLAVWTVVAVAVGIYTHTLEVRPYCTCSCDMCMTHSHTHTYTAHILTHSHDTLTHTLRTHTYTHTHSRQGRRHTYSITRDARHSNNDSIIIITVFIITQFTCSSDVYCTSAAAQDCPLLHPLIHHTCSSSSISSHSLFIQQLPLLLCYPVLLCLLSGQL